MRYRGKATVEKRRDRRLSTIVTAKVKQGKIDKLPCYACVSPPIGDVRVQAEKGEIKTERLRGRCAPSRPNCESPPQGMELRKLHLRLTSSIRQEEARQGLMPSIDSGLRG